MKPGRHSFLLAAALAASLASIPAVAQHSVSGTIAGRAPAETVAAASVPAVAGPAAANAAAAAPAAPSAPSAPAAATSAPQPALGLALPAPVPAAPSATGSLMQTTLALLFVLCLLVGLAWFLKRFGPKNFGGGNNTVRLVGALSVGARERILVVEVGEQWIVVGASPGRMNALATMPRQEVSATTPAPAGLQGANFAEWFKQTIDKRNGK